MPKIEQKTTMNPLSRRTTSAGLLVAGTLLFGILHPQEQPKPETEQKSSSIPAKPPSLIPFKEHDKKFGNKPNKKTGNALFVHRHQWFFFVEGHLLRSPNDHLKNFADKAVEKQANTFNTEDELTGEQAFYLLDEGTYNLPIGNYSYAILGEIRYMGGSFGLGAKSGYSIWTDIRSYGISDFFKGFILNARYLEMVPIEATTYLNLPLIRREFLGANLILGAGAGTYWGRFTYVAQHSFGSDDNLYEVEAQFNPFANFTYHGTAELNTLVAKFGQVGLYLNLGIRYQLAEDLKFIRDNNNKILTEPQNRSSLRIDMSGYSLMAKVGLGF